MSSFGKLRQAAVLVQLLRSPTVQVSVLYGVAGLGFVLANLLLARALSPRDYAEVTLIIALISLTYPLASLGLGEIVVRQALAATPKLLAQEVLAVLAGGLAAALIGSQVYALDAPQQGLIVIAVAGTGAASLASAKFQSEERFAISVLLAQGPSYSLLLAAVLTISLGVPGATFPVIVFTLSQVGTAFWSWRKLFAERSLAGSEQQSVRWRDALLLTGILGIGAVAAQFERMAIPLLLSLDDLARFAALAALVIAPFRIFQMAVGRTLLPRLRNAPDGAARRRLFLHECKVVGGLAVIVSTVVWLAAPVVVEQLLEEKYDLPGSLILAGLITGLVRLFGSLTITTVIALGGTRQLASWNLLGWASLLMAGAGAYVGAHWGLEGVIYGVACGTMVRVLASLPMMLPHLRGRRPPDVT